MRAKGTTLMLLMAAAILLTGCAIEGTWSLEKVNPTAARRDFDFQTFTLQNDGSYYAQSLEPPAGEIATTSGTYKFKDGELTLVSQNGEKHSYDAKLNGDQLVLERPWREGVIKATMVRKHE